MGRRLLLLLSSLVLSAGAAPAQHPGSGSDCLGCHAAGKTGATVHVVPEQPGFFARLFGKKAVVGHPSVSCAGELTADGRVTGCHRPEDARPKFLVVDVGRRPVDELCGRCHAEAQKPGQHHPSYLADRDRDGVPETPVRAAPVQEVYGRFAPSSFGEPVRSHPDALAFTMRPDGTRERQVALPLQTVVEIRGGQEVAERDVTTCSTCHNPHHGYLVEGGAGEAPDPDKVARKKGDALLRLRDYDNALCDACH